MPGGYFQLIAQGPADYYLTGNPSITFFKTVYRRYSQFSMEAIRLPFNTLPTFNPMSKTEAKCKIDRNADMLYDTYLVYDLPAIYSDEIPFYWVESIGNKIIDETTIKVNGQNLDRQYGEFMQIYSDLTLNVTKKITYNNMTNGTNNIVNTGLSLESSNYPALQSKRLIIPFQFWFCSNSGLAIPLIALQYTKLRIDVIFTQLNDLFTFGNPPLSPVEFFENDDLSDDNEAWREQLLNEGWDQTNILYRFAKEWSQYSFILANYIYLGNDERKKFAQVSHEFLIKQVQRRVYLGLPRGPNRLDLVLQHPVKELVWILRRSNAYKTNDWFNFTDTTCPKLLDNIKELRDFITEPCLQKEINSSDCDCDISNNLLYQLTNLDNTFNEYLLSVQQSNYNSDSLSNINSNRWDYYSIMQRAKLVFNGNDRFEEREKEYFQNLQTYKYHTGSGARGIYVYSFSLEPEKDQPSGTCNMSRIDEQKLNLQIYDSNIPGKKLDKFDLYLYAINYNVFRIMGGIGQIVFTN